MSQQIINKFAVAISTALIDLQDKNITQKFIKGIARVAAFKTSDGYVVMAQINETDILIVTTRTGANLEFIFLLVKRALNELDRLESKMIYQA
jgi:predicted regulator of Ras-like GTPase activity (Roadblock/LC7/MglB family)